MNISSISSRSSAGATGSDLSSLAILERRTPASGVALRIIAGAGAPAAGGGPCPAARRSRAASRPSSRRSRRAPSSTRSETPPRVEVAALHLVVVAADLLLLAGGAERGAQSLDHLRAGQPHLVAKPRQDRRPQARATRSASARALGDPLGRRARVGGRVPVAARRAGEVARRSAPPARRGRPRRRAPGRRAGRPRRRPGVRRCTRRGASGRRRPSSGLVVVFELLAYALAKPADDLVDVGFAHRRVEVGVRRR